jgi:glucosamine 6-phosphate synthetase-like amidotransferase/phosphosugar isomerase protein
MLPRGIPEWGTPLVSMVAAQLYAYHLTRVKGYDTETPRSIRKITRTQ